MICVLDIDGRNVVGKQQNLITPNLASVFQRQLIRRHQLLVLQKVHNKGTRAREGVEYIHTLVRQALSELLLQKTIRCMQNVVHYFIRCVHNAHLLRGCLERHFEELLVKIANQLLSRGIGCHHGCASLHARIHVLKHLSVGSLA